jgi:hypothetical protein
MVTIDHKLGSTRENVGDLLKQSEAQVTGKVHDRIRHSSWQETTENQDV